jgi:uncharacterized phage-associated protein
MLRTFSVERTAQAAAVLLREAEGQRMPYIRLIKLLYLADRESIQETSFPITGDDPYAMDHGPVLTLTLDLLRGRTVNPTAREAMPTWKQWIRTVGDYDVELVGDPGYRKLSRYEMKKLQEVAARYADRDHWAIIDELHRTLPEWRETYQFDGSSHRIDERTLLHAVGLGKRADEILAEAESYRSLDRTPTPVG